MHEHVYMNMIMFIVHTSNYLTTIYNCWMMYGCVGVRGWCVVDACCVHALTAVVVVEA